MNHKALVLLASLAVLAVTSSTARSHCQIPCGIYDDEVRLKLMLEHVTTIEKSMNQIVELSNKRPLDFNQIVRWVNNKEAHANELAKIVTYYFMTQRVKPVDPTHREAQAKYVRQLTLLHQILVHAMKAKQTTDLEHCAKLRELIGQFKASYLQEHTHTHATPSGAEKRIP